jgi:hypothetical protein
MDSLKPHTLPIICAWRGVTSSPFGSGSDIRDCVRFFRDLATAEYLRRMRSSHRPRRERACRGFRKKPSGLRWIDTGRLKDQQYKIRQQTQEIEA